MAPKPQPWGKILSKRVLWFMTIQGIYFLEESVFNIKEPNQH